MNGKPGGRETPAPPLAANQLPRALLPVLAELVTGAPFQGGRDQSADLWMCDRHACAAPLKLQLPPLTEQWLRRAQQRIRHATVFTQQTPQSAASGAVGLHGALICPSPTSAGKPTSRALRIPPGTGRAGALTSQPKWPW